MKRLFHHAADAIPAAIITAGVALSFAPFVIGSHWAALWIVSLAARSIAPVHHHCHSHRRTYRYSVFNHAYDLVLMLAAGNTTAVWELQHVLGHHQAYLEPAADPAGTTRFGGGPLQRIIFTIAGDFCSFGDSIAVARRQREPGWWVARLVSQQAAQLVVLAALIYWNPRAALSFFVIPWIILRWFVFYYSYSQHHGAPNHDVYSGSITRFGWTNAVFLNVGHHTAHHEKPTLHWTLLPARTQTILARIPKACLRGAA